MLLRNARQLEGHALRARDGLIGRVKDFFFDDRHWHIRYCVVETGRWLQSREVLISTAVVDDYDPTRQVFPVDLTMDQVRRSPPAAANKLMSRQHEEQLRQYYGWSGYWGGAPDRGLIAPTVMPAAPANAPAPGLAAENISARPGGDPSLRSANDTIDYDIAALDGSIGHVADFLVDDEDWCIRYIVIDTRNWWPGKKVIVAPAWIRDVNWEKAQVTIDLSREVIKAGPPYEPTMPWSEEYAAQLYEHYGRPREPRPKA